MKISQEKLKNISKQYFEKLGCLSDQAEIMVEELISSNLRGVDSHGIMRIIEYTRAVENGQVNPGAKVSVIKETANSAVVDFALNFGQIGAVKAAEVVIEKALKNGMATVVSTRAYHVGRLGAYTERVARKGLIAFGLASQSDTIVAPWGSSEGRLGTNPISFSVPTEGDPIVMDIATTTVAAGKLFIAADKGESIPEGILLNKDGLSSTDPNDINNGGAMLPLGGLTYGHKGYALSLMCEAFCTFLSGEAREGNEKRKWNNTLTLIAINPEFFFGLDNYKEKIDGFIKYMKQSKRIHPENEILMPGEYESKTYKVRCDADIEIPDKTWGDMKELFKKQGIIV